MHIILYSHKIHIGHQLRLFHEMCIICMAIIIKYRSYKLWTFSSGCLPKQVQLFQGKLKHTDGNLTQYIIIQSLYRQLGMIYFKLEAA